MGQGAGDLSLVHAVAAPRCQHEVRAIHQAGGAGNRPRQGMGARSAPRVERRRAEADFENHSPRYREAAKDSEDEMKKDHRIMRRIQIVDSHTGGEPTRVVVSGGPGLGEGPVAGRQTIFREEHDEFRSAIVNEPRGSDVLVGALLAEPSDKSCVTGVIFFNNVGVLQMCGHGTIGLVATLAHLGRIKSGEHRIETCVGVVTATLHDDGSVSVANVPSYRKAKGVTVDVPGISKVTGDVAWGGNWFYLIEDHGQELALSNVEKLTDYTWRVRQAINAQGFP